MDLKDKKYNQFIPKGFSFFDETNKKHALDPNNIKLLNWNIYKNKRNNCIEDLHLFIKELDIITIQEASANKHLTSVFSYHNFQWTLNTAFHLGNTPSGVMTAARMPSLRTHSLKHKEPIIRLPKTTLISYYPILNKSEELFVANIHGINFTLGTAAYTRQINQLFDMALKHSGPAIIAGDFNTWNRLRMNIVEKRVNSTDLTSLDYSTHIRKHVFGFPLDHVFFKGLTATEHHSWKVTSSDHNPTYVKFKLL